MSEVQNRPVLQSLLCDLVAATIYWPLARFSRAAETAGIDVEMFPLSLYRDRDFYSMRTDARDPLWRSGFGPTRSGE